MITVGCTHGVRMKYEENCGRAQHGTIRNHSFDISILLSAAEKSDTESVSYMKEDSDMKCLRDTVIRIDLDAVSRNIRNIRALVGKDVAVAAVVKANAYGHGLTEIVPTLMESGVSMLAAATLGEALAIREAYPDQDYPILIMGLTPDRCLSDIIPHHLIQTVDSFHQAEILDRLAAAAGVRAKIHIKVDTGFHRIGFPSDDAGIREMLRLKELRSLDIDGIYTHLALLDDETNREQNERFTHVLGILQQNGFSFRCIHMADSIALVDYPEYRYSMVRAGALIYGLRGFHKGYADVRQALTFETKICHISTLRAGEGVSYDYTWRAPADGTRIATLPFGYADGYPRNLRDKGYVLIRGHQCPLVGVLCMDQCMADITGVPEAAIGDTVIIYGDGSDGAPDIQKISELAGTNKNEIAARLGARPDRIYKKNGGWIYSDGTAV